MWRFNDFQNGAVHHLGFSKFRVYVTWPLSPCYSASPCKILLKLENQLLSYGQKQFSIWWPSDIFNFKYSCISYHFRVLLTMNNIVTLKSGLEVTQCHWNWCHSTAWVIKVAKHKVQISQIQDGERVPSWKSLSHHISMKIIRFWWYLVQCT